MSLSTRKQCTYQDGCKQMVAANCEGCSQALCTKHFIEHRRSLGDEMNEIISEYDQFQNTLNQQTKQPTSHALIKEIDEWEKESIAKIQQKAKELRQELLQHTTADLDNLSKNFRDLSGKLKTGQEEDSFVETDLQSWKQSLDELKANLASPPTFRITQNDNIALVKNLSVHLISNSDLFERTSDNNIRIEENGQVAVDIANDYGCREIRGKNEYTSGRHEVRLRIDYSINSWVFVGINSKLTPLQNESYGAGSTYGWSSNNHLWSGGQHKQNTSTKIEMKTNDIISLIFDCDNRKICMTNERTKATCEIPVSIDQCAFPWQLQVILREPNCRVRILPSSS